MRDARPSCRYCGSDRHGADYCPHNARGQGNRLHLRCTYCGGRDHNYEGCTKHAGGGHLSGAVRVSDA
jgi:hypothetical protein